MKPSPEDMSMTTTTETPLYHEYAPYGLRCRCGAPEFAAIHRRQPALDAGEWSLHEGEDYIVILGGEYDTTENPIARCFDSEHAQQIVADHRSAADEALRGSRDEPHA